MATEPAYQSPATAYDFTSVYAMRLGGPTGVRLRYVPHQGHDERGLTTVVLPGSSSGAESWVAIYGDYSLFIPERQSVARLWKLDINGEPLVP